MQSAASAGLRVLWCPFWSGRPRVSALTDCRMMKFLLQTSAFLRPKHHAADVQRFLPHHIQPGQTAQQCCEHPCSSAAFYLSGNLVSPRWCSYFIVQTFPFTPCGHRHSGPEPKHAQLSVPLPAMARNEPSENQDKSRTSSCCSTFPVTFPQLLICLSSQTIPCNTALHLRCPQK